MHRTIGDSYGTDGSKRIFRQENTPAWQATQLTYDTMNALQEEIANVVEAEGITLNAASEAVADMTQLNTAIDSKVADEAAARDAAITNAISDEVDDRNTAIADAIADEVDDRDAAINAAVRGRIDGFQMSYSQDADAWFIEFGAGSAGADAGGSRIFFDSTMTKQVISNAGTAYEDWVADSTNGGVAVGVAAIADGNWLHAFAIMRSDTGAVDFGFDDDLTAANLLSGAWDKYRRVGSVQIVDAGGGKYKVREFKQRGDRFLWESTVQDVTSTAVAAASVGKALTVPVGLQVAAVVSLFATESSALWRLGYWDGALGASAAGGGRIGGEAGAWDSAAVDLVTDNSATVYFSDDLGVAPQLDVFTRGWIDSRGRDA